MAQKRLPRYLYHISAYLIILLASGCSPNIKNLTSKGEAVICFGDSITYGTGAPRGEDYPSYLGKLLGRDVINAGVEGDTTYDALMRLQEDVLKRNPYIVIIEFGGNDFLRQIKKSETLKNLKEIISRIQSANAIVALCDVSSGFVMAGYRYEYRELAKQTGAIFVPELLEGILTDPSLRSDDIHPNSEGYKVIAESVHKAISRHIK